MKELAFYDVLGRYFARLSIDTGRCRLVQVVALVLRCFGVA